MSRSPKVSLNELPDAAAREHFLKNAVAAMTVLLTRRGVSFDHLAMERDHVANAVRDFKALPDHDLFCVVMYFTSIVLETGRA